MTRWRYVKTSFGFLIAGLLLGAYLIVSEFLAGVLVPRLLIPWAGWDRPPP